MTDLKTKLYQMFILGTDGDGYQDALGKGLGGIIFFTHDIKSPEQFKTLTQKIKKMAKFPPFLLSGLKISIMVKNTCRRSLRLKKAKIF